MWQDLIGIVLVIGTAVLGYRLVAHPYIGLKNLLTVDDLGRLEATLPSLVRVIVIADHVEDPQDELRAAVEANFRRGVQYLFLVARSKAVKESNRYYRIFKTLAEIAADEAGIPGTIPLVDIQALPSEWPRPPFIFYEIRENGATRFIAVRGNQLREGIADFYTLINPDYAHMIATSVLSVAPQPISISQEQFSKSNVIPEEVSALTQQQGYLN